MGRTTLEGEFRPFRQRVPSGRPPGRGGFLMSSERGIARRRRTQKGAEALEATLTFVLFFGFLFVILDISMAVFIRGDLQTAVYSFIDIATTESMNGNTYLS